MVKVGERIVVIPRWAWAVMATFGGTVVAVSVSFMAWLALTTVDHGTKLARIEAQVASLRSQLENQTQAGVCLEDKTND